MSKTITIDTEGMINKTKQSIKELFKKSIFKQKIYSEYFDTQKMKYAYYKYRNAYYNSDKIEYHDIELEDLEGFIVILNNSDNTSAVLADSSTIYNYISTDEVEVVLSRIRKRIVDSYVETNVYYRMIMGLRPLDDLDNIFVRDVTTKNYSSVDVTKPIHTMTDEELEVIYDDGVLDKLYAMYPNKKYIHYLHRRCTLFEARDAGPYEIVKLGVITGIDIMDSFRTNYNKNRFIFIRRHNNEFYQNYTEYYEQMMLLMLVWTTMMDVIRDKHNGPEIDYFNQEDVAAVFGDYGVELYSDLPTAIRSDIAANMNVLMRTAGTNNVLVNLSRIFNINNIYNYVIQKVYTKSGPELRCRAIPVNDTKNIKRYLNSDDNYITFQELVAGDPTWRDKPSSAGDPNISIQNNEYMYKGIYERLMEKDFSYIYTKYVTLDNVLNVSQMTLDMSLFFRYMQEYDNISNLQMRHQLSGSWASLFELYCYLCALNSRKWHFSDDIPSSSKEIAYVIGLHDKFSFGSIDEVPNLYDGIDVIDLIHAFEQELTGMDVVDEGIAEYRYILREWLSYNEVPGDSEKTFFNFINTFHTDRKLIVQLREIMKITYDQTLYSTVKRIFELCTTMERKKEIYGTYTSYSGLLQDANETLYNRLMTLSDLPEDIYVEEFDAEIAYVLTLFKGTIEKLKDDEITNSFSFLEDIRDSTFGELKNVLGKLINYFSAMSITTKDPIVIYELGDELDTFKPREVLNYTYDKFTQSEAISNFDKLRYSMKAPTIKEKISIRESLSIFNSSGVETYYEYDNLNLISSTDALPDSGVSGTEMLVGLDLTAYGAHWTTGNPEPWNNWRPMGVAKFSKNNGLIWVQSYDNPSTVSLDEKYTIIKVIYTTPEMMMQNQYLVTDSYLAVELESNLYNESNVQYNYPMIKPGTKPLLYTGVVNGWIETSLFNN